MVDQPNQRMIMRGGMMLPEDMVRSNTPMIPTREQENQAISRTTGVKPLSQRMSAAYDRMKENESKPKKMTSKETVIIGKLMLEIEQVKNNLNSFYNQYQTFTRKKIELEEEEKELLEKENDRLVALGASFKKFRRSVGGIAAALSGKAFLEGDIGGGLENAGIALTAFLPEIIKVVSTVVLGKMLLSGRGMGATRNVATGGGRGLLPMLLAGGGLLAAGTALGSRGSGDQRRLELTRRQALPQLLSRNDVRRFRTSTTRFDNILGGMTSGSQSAFSTTPMEVGEDIDEPKGFLETARDFGGGIIDFFRGDNNEETDDVDSNEDDGIEPDKKNNIFTMEDYEKQIESDFIEIFGKGKLINVLPDDEVGIVNNNNIIATGGEGSQPNVITIGSEDKQITNNNSDTPSTSNVYVKSTFSDNSKISYILEYGGGSVV